MEITYHTGDAIHPKVGEGENFAIIHICNDIGIWGGGFTASVSKRYQKAEHVYRNTFVRNLGDIQVVPISDDKGFIINMIAQRSVGNRNRKNPPIRYKALEVCLYGVNRWIDLMDEPISIHMPRIGCGLAGGKWEEIEPLITRVLNKEAFFPFNQNSRLISVNVYDLPGK